MTSEAVAAAAGLPACTGAAQRAPQEVQASAAPGAAGGQEPRGGEEMQRRRHCRPGAADSGSSAAGGHERGATRWCSGAGVVRQARRAADSISGEAGGHEHIAVVAIRAIVTATLMNNNVLR
ncbi:hypothetical protein ZWY2020_058103 [Hordeum vulgare]|nr:hypothetical protein ZWY2020_058103 [Hordeum vulgare]